MAQLRDLLGDPILPEVEARGRPAHVPTEEKRLQIAALAADNWTHDEIAEGVGLSTKTLRKYYSPELKNGASLIEAALIRALTETALIKRSVPAIRAALAHFDRGGMSGNKRQRPTAPPKPVKLGKKERERLDAETPDLNTSLGQLMARHSEMTDGKPH